MPAPSEKPSEPVVDEVLAFAPESTGCSGSRRVIVRWSDGTTGEALRWYSDELLFCEGDILGKTENQLRALKHTRDRDYLQS